jgi:dTDP-glucose 4,6-dehydratase
VHRLLVTGGAGFIGSEFVRRRIARFPEDRIVVVDALTYAGNTANLATAESHPGFRFVHGDILDEQLIERLLREERLETIVHFAAESHVDRSIRGPDAFIEVNVQGTHTLLKAAKKVWLDEQSAIGAVQRFHHVSTDEVYGSLEPDDPAFTEASRYAPNSPYAASKAAADHLVRAYRETWGLPVSISVCSNTYGPYQFPEKLIPFFTLSVLHGRDLPVYGDGQNIRDWLHVSDHCRGIDLVLERGAAGEIFNIGAENERPNLEVVQAICRAADDLFRSRPALRNTFPDAPPARGEPSESLIRFVRDRPGHDRRYGLDAGRIREALGYRPTVPFEEGLRETVRWYVDNPGWWQPLMDASYRDWLRDQYGSSG